MKNKSTDERSTPQELFKLLDDEFHFTLDVCASNENHKCDDYYTKEDNGLIHSWMSEVCFMNPPYSNIYEWLRKAINEAAKTVAILPCDTSTRWFHDFLWDESKHECSPNIKLRFPKGRFKFGSYNTSPKFATIIAIIN